MQQSDRPNPGIIARGYDSAEPVGGATLLITGVARSGTTMIASVLRSAGVFLGEYLHEAVHEDSRMLGILQHGDERMLRDLIAERNAEHVTWGFKLPTLHALMRYNWVGYFRQPRLIIIYRDPVAIAVRDSLSEHFEERQSLISATHAMTSLAMFADRANCPTLMLSYEKAIMDPEGMLHTLLGFCGLPWDPETITSLAREVRPNNPIYHEAASLKFPGKLEGIIDGQVYGWCCQSNSLEPVELDLFADGECLATFHADRFRADLARSGIGNGNHGFYIDITGYGLAPDVVLNVRPHNRTVALEGGGRTVRQLLEAHAAASGDAVADDPLIADAPPPPPPEVTPERPIELADLKSLFKSDEEAGEPESEFGFDVTQGPVPEAVPSQAAAS